MDILERAEAERIQREETLRAARAKREERPRTDMPAADYPVTIIGCIRGRDGWYRAGFDERSQTIKPVQALDSSRPHAPRAHTANPEKRNPRRADTASSENAVRSADACGRKT